MKTITRLLVFVLFSVSASAQLYRPLFYGPMFSSTQSGTVSNIFLATNLVSSAPWLTMNTARLLGRSTASAGGIEEITIGTGLSLSGGTLSSSVSSTLNSITADTASSSINNAAFTNAFNWTLTGAAQRGFRFGELSASTGGGAGNQYIHTLETMSGSTANPLGIFNQGTNVLTLYGGTGQLLMGPSGGNPDLTYPLYSYRLNNTYGRDLASGGYLVDIISGTERLRIDSAGIKVGAGSAGGPSIASTVASSSGILFPSASSMAISGGGTKIMSFTNNSVIFELSGDFANSTGQYIGYTFTDQRNGGLAFHNNQPSLGVTIYNTTNNALAFDQGRNAGGGVTAYNAAFNAAGHDYAAGLRTLDVLYPSRLHQWYINSPVAASQYPALVFADPNDSGHGTPSLQNAPGLFAPDFYNVSVAVEGNTNATFNNTNIFFSVDAGTGAKVVTAITTNGLSTVRGLTGYVWPTAHTNGVWVDDGTGRFYQATVGTGLSLSSGVLSATGGGAPVGTVVNTGASVAAQIPIYSDTTGTNVAPTTFLSAVFASPVFAGTIFTNIVYTNLLSGDVDFYTVPAGYVGFLPVAQLYNTTNATVTYYNQKKVSGVYYRLSSPSTITTTNKAGVNHSMAVNAGEAFSFNFDITGTTIHASIMLVPTNSGLSGILVTSFNTGTNTLYTVPTGKSAVLYAPSSFTTMTSAPFFYFNNSGATVTHTLYSVASGDVASELNRISFASQTASATTVGSPLTPSVIFPSDSTIVDSMSSNGATQYTMFVIRVF